MTTYPTYQSTTVSETAQSVSKTPIQKKTGVKGVKQEGEGLPPQQQTGGDTKGEVRLQSEQPQLHTTNCTSTLYHPPHLVCNPTPHSSLYMYTLTNRFHGRYDIYHQQSPNENQHRYFLSRPSLSACVMCLWLEVSCSLKVENIRSLEHCESYKVTSTVGP